ncbi:hypothetical protein KY290_000764 [Solanum tuberosum]|uniref:Uncharacterized protein n=1 Tax=Solanum tuberosum TaxID=4113 RepID=A0ABQ7WK87_SOLTU|nr:hypothetical protein KY289_000824 [Solanum tuberosum]KAH0781166.1 hypothetical protein KY290_000764 [Solanum tuberosum]
MSRATTKNTALDGRQPIVKQKFRLRQLRGAGASRRWCRILPRLVQFEASSCHLCVAERGRTICLAWIEISSGLRVHTASCPGNHVKFMQTWQRSGHVKQEETFLKWECPTCACSSQRPN